jgi:hypothetical protein
MVTIPAFDATIWIKQNTKNGTLLTPETVSAVASFTMMWNIFEGSLCNNSANIQEFKRIAKRIDKISIPNKDIKALEDCLNFWKFRYVTPNGLSKLFNGLNFRSGDNKNIVEDVLNTNSEHIADKVFALMIIVYRLRNNLFHGLKSIDELNHQVDNINTASQCIAILMPILGTNFVLS